MKQGSEVGEPDRRGWQALIVMQLALFASVGCYSAAIQRHLYADGSNFFLMILKYHKVTEFYPSRYYAHALTQFPAVFLLREFDCRNLTLLSLVFGATLYLLPLVCLAITAWAARRTSARLLVYPLVASSIIFLDVSGFIISESHVAAALVWPILYLILFSERLCLLRSILLLALTFAATRSYQSYLFLSWPLIFVAVRRGKVECSKRNPLGAIACFCCCGLLLLAFYIALESIIRPHDPWSDFLIEQSIRHLKYPPVWFSLMVLVDLLWSEFLPHQNNALKIVRRITYASGVFAALLPLLGIIGAGFQYYSRVQTLYVPFVLMVAVIVKTRVPLLDCTRSVETRRLALWVCVVAAVFQIGSVVRWNAYRTVVLHELADRRGLVDFAESAISNRQLTRQDYPSILLNTYPNQFNWGWAIPSLSVTLGAVNTGSVKTIILAPEYEKFQPFDPHHHDRIPDLRDYGIISEIDGNDPAEQPDANESAEIPIAPSVP